MEPLRILHYIGSLESGGSQAMIMEIYRNIDKKIIQFDFVVDRKKDFFYKEEIEKNGGKIYYFDEYFKGINYIHYKKQWNNFFKSHKEYKIIHCHVRSVASIVLKIGKKYGLKTICHSHGASNGKGIKAFAKKILQTNIPRHSDYLLACSKESAIWLYGNKYANSPKCVIIKNGIDFKKFCFDIYNRKVIRKKYAIEDDNILIGHIGRFDPIKNHAFIIELAKYIINNHNYKYKFMLCGDGPLKEHIINEINKNNLSNHFIIVDSTKEINKYYSAFDLFILPSRHEGLGIVLIEAQFNGLTCLVSPNIPDEACISNGFVKKKLDVKIWSDYLENSMNYQNRKLFLNDNSKTYNINESCKKLINIYFDMIK